MTEINNQFADIINQIAEIADHTKESTGPAFEIVPAGTTLARFVDYIEVGNQPRKPYKGAERKPAPQVLITFELLGKNYVKEIEVDGAKKTIANRITVPMNLSLNEKAKFRRLFKRMAYGRSEITHMSQMLGEGFKVSVVHNDVGEGDKKKTYANITDDEGNFLVEGPFTVDALAETKQVHKVPPMVGKLRMFLWDIVNAATWGSVFIDGDREKTNADGTKETVSKNYLQEKITSATNFEGSPIQEFLDGSDQLPETLEEVKEEVTEVEETELAPVTVAKEEPKDALAALGLN